MSKESYTTKLTVQADGKAVDLLHAHTSLPKSCIKDAMHKGAVWYQQNSKNQRLRRGSARVQKGDVLAIYYNSEVLATQPPKPSLITDRYEYSIWYKPAGMMSSGSRFGDHHSIARWVQLYFDRPTFLVHRLDRFTRGVILLGHTKKTAANLSRQFAQRETTKIYQALVEGTVTERFEIETPLDGKPAVSLITPLSPGRQSVVEVNIKTGRKHQIRRHLAEAGHPVVGDIQYGGSHQIDLQLVAVRLGFCCPIDQQHAEYELHRALRLA